MLLYSGHEEDNAPHTEGFALMLSQSALRALIGWEAHGPRIITVSFRTKEDISMNVIKCYSPTNNHEEETKDEFYDRLQNLLDKYSEKDMILLMGDKDAKIGEDNIGYEEVMGRHGLGEMNNNGEKLLDICASNKLVIGGSIFPHKNMHKATWVTLDHVMVNQIDHFALTRGSGEHYRM